MNYYDLTSRSLNEAHLRQAIIINQQPKRLRRAMRKLFIWFKSL